LTQVSDIRLGVRRTVSKQITEVFVEMQSGRGLVTLGVLLTLPENGVAEEYTNPVLVVTGDHDL